MYWAPFSFRPALAKLKKLELIHFTASIFQRDIFRTNGLLDIFLSIVIEASEAGNRLGPDDS